MVKQEGLLSFYKGFWATFNRDIPGWAVYFYSYVFFKNQFKYLFNDHSQNLVIMNIAGGLAGMASWLVSYPFDVVKTSMQCDFGNIKMKQVIRKKYNQEGWKYFFKGLSPTLLRAFQVNAVCLSSFEYLNVYFGL